MKKDGLNSWITLPSRGYYRVGDSGNSIAQIDSFLANKIRGNYYGTYTNYAVRALQTIGRQDGVYTDVIDGNFGPMTLATAEYYGFNY
jgi:peptidoglycan hydrolase-like protein with peptidoglycan-binding domain